MKVRETESYSPLARWKARNVRPAEATRTKIPAMSQKREPFDKRAARASAIRRFPSLKRSFDSASQRLAATSERIVNFKARLITSII